MRMTKWMVREHTVAGQKFYQVYRIVEGNVQTYGGPRKYRTDAEDLCGRINRVARGFRDEVLP